MLTWLDVIVGLSPDAYVQMAIQLAWYKTHGSFTATYETVLTCAFDKARTETIRTLSEDSRAWVLSMANETATVCFSRLCTSCSDSDNLIKTTTRVALLCRAIQTHTSLTREAATGRGIDRHLLGLRLMMRPETGERAALFDDPLFERSQEWKLSTSALSAGYQFRGAGCVGYFFAQSVTEMRALRATEFSFGAPYHDGYGISCE